MLFYNTMWRFFNRQSTNASFNVDCPPQEEGCELGILRDGDDRWIFGGLNFIPGFLGGKQVKQVFFK